MVDMQKILLLQPKTNWLHPYVESPSIGLLTLGALARRLGHEVKVQHLDIDVLDTSFMPDLVGITCNTFQVKSARELVGLFNDKGIPVALGGPHAIAWNKQKDGYVNDLVVGEGENRWLEILGQPPIEEIDDIPLPDYSLVDMSRFCGVIPMGSTPSMVLFGSKGCPGKCTFCNTPVFWGRKCRYRNPISIVDQIALLNREYGVQEVFIQDDTFNSNMPWAQEIFGRIITMGLHKKMVFRIACRSNEKMLTENFLKAARNAGVWNIFIGVESGSQKMLYNMKKHVTVEEHRRALQLIPQYGMKVQASFIIGLPGETWDTIAETQKFINDTKPWMIGAGYATPFPGTEFDRYVTEREHKLPIDYADYMYGNVMVRTDELTYDDLRNFKGYQVK